MMVHAIPRINEMCLLFDTPLVEGSALASKGLWAGSGEVKAAHMIGECTAQVVPHYKVALRRWSELGHAELERERLSMILLGSALNEEKMNTLRERGRWRGQQQFHFEQSKKGNHSVYIREGILGRPEKSDPLFRYEASKGGRPEVDYALVSFFKDTYYSQTLIAMQGISTAGTLAAAQFLCTEAGVKRFFTRIREDKIDTKRGLPAFELLLRVEVHQSSPDEEVTTIERCIWHHDAKPS